MPLVAAATSWDVGIYQNAALQGVATIMDVLSARHNVTLQRGWNGVLPMPLHWGEVLALSYVANASAAHRLPPLVTLGLPLSRYNLSSAVATGFLQLGRDLGRLSRQDTAPRETNSRQHA
ncbi:hypothetical protein EMIHUDRAFT_243699 [Emiliania huxleyi CCMP1516]|uniref:Uncharacterized protein n=2 Tax=Emiliania huxleyi TaxID=2903 RepID=A0A0D3J507_EMIH1|nr:hypothetical protein EMIHUDRAFT_243699 [Emiliania huxleyi CCMP1516]EOD18592.1 hypothetical protein EMIHUDRAFT_243699 [Emiliania huxleyi CCMP1516]|eukprot:XP_005771021.1 hypothetical protein EMIHUDRAFT_243699 [Emiliania huxleyi CCMP1516]